MTDQNTVTPAWGRLDDYLGGATIPVPTAILDLGARAAARAKEFEAVRQVHSDFAREMAQENLFRMFVPASLGGPDFSLPTGLAVLEQLARHDGAVAWISMIGTTSALAAHFMSPAIARDIFAGPAEGSSDSREASAIYGGIFAPSGRAHPSGDGYLLSGRWSWASGSANADWMVLGALLGAAETTPDSERCLRFFAVSRNQFTVHDTWHALGLNATSSGDVSVDRVNVPRDHCLDLLGGTIHTPSAISRLPYFGVLALGIGACALGNALAGCAAFEALAQNGPRPLAHQSRVQSDYAVILGDLLAARAFYWQSVFAIWEKNKTAPSPEDRAVLRLAATHMVRAALRTVRQIHDLVGGRGVYRDQPFQKYLRDGETMSQHMMTALPSYTLAGRVWLGGYSPDLQL